MTDKSSLYKLVGLPDAFGVVLLGFAFILVLAPYFSGADFGLFKIPNFSDSAKRSLKIIGPIVFCLCVLSFVPLVSTKTQGQNEFWTREKSEEGMTLKAVPHSYSTLEECLRAEQAYSPPNHKIDGFGCKNPRKSIEELERECNHKSGEGSICGILEYRKAHPD